MKIIFGAFDKVDVRLLSYENIIHHMHYRILQKALKLKRVKKIAKKFFEKSSNCRLAARKYTIYYLGIGIILLYLGIAYSAIRKHFALYFSNLLIEACGL